MTIDPKNPPISSLLDLTSVREPTLERLGFDIAPEVVLTDAGPNFRPGPYRALVLDLPSRLIIARRLGA